MSRTPKPKTEQQKNNEKPVPVKLGDMKPILQKEAFEKERSLHWLIKKILATHIANTSTQPS